MLKSALLLRTEKNLESIGSRNNNLDRRRVVVSAYHIIENRDMLVAFVIPNWKNACHILAKMAKAELILTSQESCNITLAPYQGLYLLGSATNS